MVAGYRRSGENPTWLPIDDEPSIGNHVGFSPDLRFGAAPQSAPDQHRDDAARGHGQGGGGLGAGQAAPPAAAQLHVTPVSAAGNVSVTTEPGAADGLVVVGAKGIGEASMNPVAAAYANAIYGAIGVRFYDLPITPEKVLDALNKASPGTDTLAAITAQREKVRVPR